MAVYTFIAHNQGHSYTFFCFLQVVSKNKKTKMRSSTVASSESLTLITLMLRADFAQTPDMCGELSSVEGVTAEEGEDTAGSVVSAVHTLRLQLQVKLQRSVHHHLSQGGLPFERS